MTRRVALVGHLPLGVFREARQNAAGGAGLAALPPLGLIGAEAIREAFAGDYQQLEELLRGELRKIFKLQGDADPWPHVRALFDDSVVVEKDGKLWSYPYTVDGTAVTLSAPTEVVQRYLPATAAVREARSSDGVSAGIFLESEGGAAATKGRWLVRVIRAGMSGNGNYYPDATLREALALFEGARVFVKSDEEHLAGKGKDVRNLVGRLTEARFVEGAGKGGTDTGEIQAVLELIEPDGAVGGKLREAHARGMGGLFGLSIDAIGPYRRKKIGGREARYVEAFKKVASVDLIVEPGAGGEIINLIEAVGDQAAPNGDEDMWRDRLIRLIESKKPSLLKGKDATKLSDEQLEGLLREALGGSESEAEAEGGAGGGQPAGAAAGDAALREATAYLDARLHLREALAEAKLPKPAKDRLRQHFDGMERFTEAQVDQAIKDEREYLAQFTESGTVAGLGGDLPDGRFSQGESRPEKVAAMLDAFFDPQNREVRSIRECYIEITGDSRVTGQLRECNDARLRESLGSDSFMDVLGDGIRRRMVAEYRRQNQYDIWKRIANVVPVNDFRTNERTRWGGYGDLPVVAERAPYLELTSPTDEKATYAIAKRGGVETVTLEMIKNDDVGVVQRLPGKMTMAAKRTLAKFVLDFIRTNPVIYDTKNLFHNDHNNLGTAALDATSLAAGRLAMTLQTEMDSGDPLGIGPRSLLVPPQLEETAANLFRRSTENDKTFIQSLTLDILPVWYWADVTDWALVADPAEIPTIEIGFLDGADEPDIFVQDNPNSGSLFSHDQITYKIRHPYGGVVEDYRGMYKAVVAG